MKHRRWLDKIGVALLVLLAAIGLLSLVVPTLIVVVESLDTRRFISFPPQGYSLGRYRDIVRSAIILQSAKLSALTALATVSIDLLLGVPAAITLVRQQFRGKTLLTVFLLSPIMLPGIVIGISVLIFYSALGFSPSLPLMVLSHVVFTLPFVIRLTMARMERLDRALEEAAQNLGAGRWQVFWHILAPHLWPGLAAGSGFAFLTSFDNLDISLFTAPIRQRPLPIELFYMMRFNLDPRVSAIASLEFLFAFLLVALVGRKLRSSGIVQDL